MRVVKVKDIIHVLELNLETNEAAGIVLDLLDYEFDIAEEPKEKIMKWIPCTEKLPNEYELVLCTCKYDTGNYTVRTGILDDNNRWIAEDGEYLRWYEMTVIAWMPLPQPWRGRK